MTIVRDAMITQTKQACTVVCFDPLTGLMLATHRKDDFSSWGMPGGKVDPGESPLEAVIRELGEETPYVALIDNIEYLGVRPCYGEVYYDVHTYLVKDASLLKLNISLKGVKQNYGWVHPRLLTKGPFANFNSLLFSEFAEKIFGKLFNHLVWNKQYKQHIDNMSDEFPEDYEVN